MQFFIYLGVVIQSLCTYADSPHLELLSAPKDRLPTPWECPVPLMKDAVSSVSVTFPAMRGFSTRAITLTGNPAGMLEAFELENHFHKTLEKAQWLPIENSADLFKRRVLFKEAVVIPSSVAGSYLGPNGSSGIYGFAAQIEKHLRYRWIAALVGSKTHTETQNTMNLQVIVGNVVAVETTALKVTIDPETGIRSQEGPIELELVAWNSETDQTEALVLPLTDGNLRRLYVFDRP